MERLIYLHMYYLQLLGIEGRKQRQSLDAEGQRRGCWRPAGNQSRRNDMMQMHSLRKLIAYLN